MLKARANQMRNFLNDDSFYLNPLSEKLGITELVKDVTECEIAYSKLIKYISCMKNDYSDKTELVHCYALTVDKFLIEQKGFQWTLKKKYEPYNPYYYPEISNDKVQDIDVISNLFMAVGNKRKASFREFYWHITGIPVDENID
ncbi:hypothetical protein AB6805_13750 [Chitinophaga sp. RCC_12]|uniref:hypothetical protein n=1 Tax=Chitinophaga sp. RCC_12 TaxID=3239226 RepID=UPI003523A210